jgi:CheY-like chemotaxis protein
MKDSRRNQSTSTPNFSRRVLVVDDDESLRATTAAALTNRGYDVITAADGFEALAVLRSGLPDLIVSDLKMPNMSGFELLAVVRKRFPGVTVIATSAEFSPVHMPDGLLCDGFVEKTSGGSGLVEMVDKLLQQSPFRSQPAKPDSAPAWLPRSTTAYVVLTCPMCLRSFSVTTQKVEHGVVLTESCLHCDVKVTYRFDDHVISKRPYPPA